MILERPPLSEEHKAAISKALSGRTRPPCTEEHKKAISQALKGHHISSDVRAKISLAQKGKSKIWTKKKAPVTDEHRAALSKALKGKPKRKGYTKLPFTAGHRLA